jgi:hypothetical protein
VSTLGYLMYLVSTTISYISHKKIVPTYYTTEKEYVVDAEAKKKIVCLENILEDLEEKQVNTTLILMENIVDVYMILLSDSYCLMI